MLNTRLFRAAAPVVTIAGLAAGMLFAGGSAASAAPIQAAAGCDWTVHTLPGLPGGSRAEILGTDGSRTWAGSATDAGFVQHAVLWRNGQVVDLGTPLGGDSVAKDVNRLGIAVGSSDEGTGPQHAEMWVGTHAVRLGEPAGAFDSTATGINDAGEIVGWATMGDDFSAHPVVWSVLRPGAARDLGTPAGTSTFLNGVSETGVLAGTRTAFPDQNAVTGTALTGLHVLPGTSAGALTTATSAAGRYIVGEQLSVDDPAGTGMLRWNLGRPELTPADSPDVSAVNTSGLVTGNLLGSGAVVWRNGEQTALPAAGGTFTQAEAVSEAGTVGGQTSTGTPRTFAAALWTCG
jgi:uncharacterized membrane protein